MTKHLIAASSIVLLMACVTPYRLVYSNGFSFSNYDYLVIAKPDPSSTSTSLYGMDIEFANMMSRYNMKVLGDKEFQSLPQEQKKRTLFARMSMVSTSARANLLSVSFDDAESGRTVASITEKAQGDMFNADERTRAFESLSNAILQAMERDKGLKVQDQK